MFRKQKPLALAALSLVTLDVVALSAQTTVPTAGAPTYLALDEITNKIYVVDDVNVADLDSVTVIDGATNDTTTVPVGHGSFPVGQPDNR